MKNRRGPSARIKFELFSKNLRGGNFYPPPSLNRVKRIKLFGKKIRKEPKNKSFKSELFADKKKLKKMVKNNKLAFKNQLMENMKQSRNDSKKFWKLLDKFERKSDDTVLKQGIKDQRWVSHFKSIFNSTDSILNSK